MIVDTSAIIAVLLDEPEGARMTTAMLSEPPVRMSAAAYVECAVVADHRSKPATRAKFDQILEELGVETVAVTPEQAAIAREAYRVYGRGSGHPAQLNLGDCFSYALAADMREPLLFKGGDFSETDITPQRY